MFSLSALWINLPGLWGLMFLCGFSGLVAFAYYEKCDPLTSKQISKPDQVRNIVLNTMVLENHVSDITIFCDGYIGPTLWFARIVYSGDFQWCNEVLYFQISFVLITVHVIIYYLQYNFLWC